MYLSVLQPSVVTNESMATTLLVCCYQVFTSCTRRALCILNRFTSESIRWLQSLPRTILSDACSLEVVKCRLGRVRVRGYGGARPSHYEYVYLVSVHIVILLSASWALCVPAWSHTQPIRYIYPTVPFLRLTTPPDYHRPQRPSS
jgi:hypothetical protein